MNAIEERFRKQTVRSAQLAERAEHVMPGGDTRTTTYHRPYPLAIDRGEGPFLFDVDGNRYIDLLGNYTSLVHGHAYPPIVEAVARAARKGTAGAGRGRAQNGLGGVVGGKNYSGGKGLVWRAGLEDGVTAR